MKKIFVFFIITIASYSSLLAEGRTGEVVYKAHCATCHSIGVANAPKLNDPEAWKKRNKDTKQFLESSKKGINAMPPMGTCMNCDDQELSAAIEYMVGSEKSQQ